MLRHHKRALLNDAAGLMPRSAFESFKQTGERKRHRGEDGSSAAGGTSAATKAQQQNQMATQLILAQAQPLIQPIFSTTISANNAAQGQTLNIPMNNVGLNTKITVEVSGTIAQVATETITKTAFGLANFFSNVTLTDLSNFQRVNTTGWHLYLLAAIRRQQVYGAAYTTDAPPAMGSNFPVMVQPTGGGVTTTPAPFRFFFEVPLAFHDWDLRGAIWANVTGAQWRLGLTINPNLVLPNTAPDKFLGVWSSSTAVIGLVAGVNITVYQHFFDQLPVSGNGQILPTLSLAYNYMLINTIGSSALVANVDIPVQYANFRTYYSTVAIFDNAGTFNTGSDVNYIAVQSANLIYLQKFDPYMAALMTRNYIGDDPPAGTYIVNHRRRPVATNQYGNMQFVINAASVTAGATLQMGYEMLAIQSQAINAGSLAAQ